MNADVRMVPIEDLITEVRETAEFCREGGRREDFDAEARTHFQARAAAHDSALSLLEALRADGVTTVTWREAAALGVPLP